MMDALHFLRPAAFWLLLPLAFILWAQLRRQDQRTRWLKAFSPQLLDALLMEQAGNSRFRPVGLFAVVSLLGVIALAGPAWQLEKTPFSEDQSALVVVLQVTESMNATDLQPSRQQRSVQKIRDLMALRGGARTALVAYAGSAHLVMPLTRDASVITAFASELSADVMPLEGNDAAAALQLAQKLIRDSGRTGSILLITDDLDPGVAARIAAQRGKGIAAPVMLAAVDEQRSPADAERLRQAADQLGASMQFMLADDRDIRTLVGKLDTHLSDASDPDQAERWKDGGYWLLPLLALLSLVWFRPGWYLAWE
jgi:Ca-activated chloride channel family protein